MPATVVITNLIGGLTDELPKQMQSFRELGCVHDTDFEGKTAPFDSIDLKIDAPQLLLLFSKQDLVNQCKDKLSRNKKFVPATLCFAGPSPPSERIKAQVVVGTPGCMKRWISAHKAVHTTHINTLVFAEADHIFAKAEYVDDSLRLVKYVKKKQSSEFEETPEFQALLLTSTSNHEVDSFISKAIPEGTNRFISDHAQLSPVLAWEYHIVFSDASAQIDSCKEVMKDRFSRDTHGVGETYEQLGFQNNGAGLEQCQKFVLRILQHLPVPDDARERLAECRREYVKLLLDREDLEVLFNGNNAITAWIGLRACRRSLFNEHMEWMIGRMSCKGVKYFLSMCVREYMVLKNAHDELHRKLMDPDTKAEEFVNKRLFTEMLFPRIDNE